MWLLPFLFIKQATQGYTKTTKAKRWYDEQEYQASRIVTCLPEGDNKGYYKRKQDSENNVNE